MPRTRNIFSPTLKEPYTLSSDDILHYQKMIVALVETGKLMEEVNETIEANGGWPIK